MSFWRARLLSSTVAIFAALAWFTSTNHCLLGAVNAGQSTAGFACHCAEHCKTSGAQSQGASAMLACCQGLLSPSVDLTQAKLHASLIFLGFQPSTLDRLTRFEASLIPNLGADYDTGPPKRIASCRRCCGVLAGARTPLLGLVRHSLVSGGKAVMPV